MSISSLCIIIPCYNEEEVLPITAPMFLSKLAELIDGGKISPESRIMFVNDGSSDSTWNIISELAENDRHYIGISQSRNRGHQNAVLAGLMEAKDRFDVTISIDCDGQDDINAMDEMIKDFYEGSEIVYGVRSDRKTDTWLKRTTAQGFYKFMKIMDVELVYNHADYRLISSRVLHHLAHFEEVNLFLRGMVPLLGFKSSIVYYIREERIAGGSHYSLKNMLNLALNGITSLSVKPISMIMNIGMLLVLLGIVGIIINCFFYKTIGNAVFWLILAVGGFNSLCIGIVGQYVGKAYMETKHRPRYIISERTYDK